MHELVFDHSEDITSDIKTFWFSSAEPYFYLAGQYTFVRIPHDDMDSRGDTRLMSFSSSMTEDLISVSVKICENGSTYKQALLALKPGDKILAAEPMGDFILPKNPAVPLLFIAAGIGSAPIRSMVKWLTDNKEQRPVKFIYATRNSKDLAFLPIFANYDMEFIPILSQPNRTWKGETGHLDASRILGLTTPTPETMVYISGASNFVDEMSEGLESLGMKRQQIVRDAFPGY